MFLLPGTGQVGHQFCGKFWMGAVTRYRQAPATEGGGMAAGHAASGQGRDADFIFYCTILALYQGLDIRPVTHEQRISRLEYATSFFLGVVRVPWVHEAPEVVLRQVCCSENELVQVPLAASKELVVRLLLNAQHG